MDTAEAMVQRGRAEAIASIAHRGQTDKLGESYINHPARVAEAFDWLDEPVAHCAAWLHDVIEDSDITATDLRAAGVLPDIVDVVELMTRTADVSDDEYYLKIKAHTIAVAVKLADIADNEAQWRLGQLDAETRDRLAAKYAHAKEVLLAD